MATDPDAALRRAKPGLYKPAAASPPPPLAPVADTGTIADTVEQLPELRPVRPTAAPIEDPASLGETFHAARREARSDRSDFDEIRLRDGYQPIIAALGLPDSESPARFYEDRQAAYSGGTAMFGQPSRLATDANQGVSPLGGKMRLASRELQERLIVDQIRARRAKDPGFLKGVPDTVDGLHAYFLANEKKQRDTATATLSRSTGLSGTLAQFAGGAVESFHDPVNLATLPIGGGGKTIIQTVARETLINGMLELAQQPIVAHNRAELGEHLTLGEAASNTITAGLAGGVLEGAMKGVGKGVKATGIPAAAASRVREAAAALAARGMQIHIDPKMPIDRALAELDNRSLVALHREMAGEKSTPDERAAGTVLERGQDIGESSPYRAGPAGDGAHESGLAQAIKDLEDQVAPVDDAGATGAAASAAAPARPPADLSTARRPQSGDAIESFKAKTRHVESTGNDAADNPRSSADGRFQITDGTFRTYHKRLFGTDPGEHPSKAVKNNPDTQEKIMDALTRDNAAHLSAIGEAVNDGNLYLEHFLGSGDAAKLFKAAPDAPIERILPAGVIDANPFLKGKSVSETIAWAHEKMGGASSSVAARRGFSSSLDPASEDPRIAQLRAEAMQLDDSVIGATRLPDGTAVNLHASRVPASSILVDAERFQFKSGGDAEGVTERLKGVGEWDPGLSGRVTLWQDNDGRLFVADGHQRVALAKRLGADGAGDIPLDAMVLRERDGISAVDARTWAALKNIAEGTGSAIDAAKVARDAGVEALKRLPPRSALVRDAGALARLSDEAFGAVYNGVIPPDFAAVIGHLLPDRPEAHAAMVDLLAKIDPANRGQAESIVRQGLAAGFHVEHQDELFGPRDVMSSMMLERAKVLEKGLAKIRKMRLVHSTAAKEKDALEAVGSTIAAERSAKEATANAEAAQIVSRLAFSRGPVADALNVAASKLAAGGKLADIVDAFVRDVRKLDLAAVSREAPVDDASSRSLDGGGRLGETGEAGAAISPEPADPGEPDLLELQAATERFSDPDGQAVRQQADSLVHDFKALIESGAETRGLGVQLHGARGEIPNLTEGYSNVNNIYGGFETFYTTDAADIAGGYRRKNPNGRIYQVVEKAPVKFFDMEQELPTAELERLFGKDDLAGMAIDEVAKDGKAKLREVMDEMRGLSAGEGISKDGVQEIFDSAIVKLMHDGYGGMSHIGGLKTGREPHTVKIYFDAANQLDLKDVTPGAAATDPLKADLSKISAEDLPALFDQLPQTRDAWHDLRVRVVQDRPDLAARALDQMDRAPAEAVDPVEEAARAADRARQLEIQGDQVAAIQAHLSKGGKVTSNTYTTSLTLTSPDHIRDRPSGPVEIMERGKWVALTKEGLDRLAAQAGWKKAPDLSADLVRFASGMSRRGDLEAGSYALGGSDKMGVGVEAGELSSAGIDQIARAIVDWRTDVFVDSGAFGLFRRNLRQGEGMLPLGADGRMDFDKVLARYDEIEQRIGDYNDAEIPASDRGRLLLVMPDVVGDQAASLELLRRYQHHIATHVGFQEGGTIPIVPLQKGELSLEQAWHEAAKILGRDDFVVGIPSNEAALSTDEFRQFLEHAKPWGIHFLGATSEKTLGPKLAVLNEVGRARGLELHHLTADANLLRSKLYGRADVTGEQRPTAVMDTLRKEDLALGSSDAKQFAADTAVLEDRRAARAATLDNGAAVDPAIAERQRQEVGLRAASPLRPGAVDAKGELGLALFDQADQFGFRLDEEGGTVKPQDLLDELAADDAAIKAIKDCL